MPTTKSKKKVQKDKTPKKNGTEKDKEMAKNGAEKESDGAVNLDGNDGEKDFETFMRKSMILLNSKVDSVISFQNNAEKRIEDLERKAKDNDKDIEEIKESLDFQDGRIKDTETKIELATQGASKQSGLVDELQSDVAMLKRQINDLERYTRSFNLRFLSIPEADDENCRSVLSNLLKTHLKIDGDIIENAHRTGRKPDGGKPRQLIARFHSRIVRNKVITAARKAEVKPPFIVVDDLTYIDLEEKRRVGPLMKKLYREGKRSRFHGGRLYVGRRALTQEQVQAQLDGIVSSSDNDAD